MRRTGGGGRDGRDRYTPVTCGPTTPQPEMPPGREGAGVGELRHERITTKPAMLRRFGATPRINVMVGQRTIQELMLVPIHTPASSIHDTP